MGGELLDHEVDGKETEGATFATPPVHQHGALFSSGLFDEADYGIDDALVDDGLDAIFGPIEGEEAHALDGGVVLRVPTGAIDDMRDLVESQPLDVLLGELSTCAITSSPMKMQSVTFVGIDSSYRPVLA